MASSVYYKFKSQKDESKVSFDGTGISVFDLKKEIILANNLKANDFDLLLFDSSTNQEYKDDSYMIPRSSSVVAKRIPAARPGKGKAAVYAAASMSTSTMQPESAAGKDKQILANPIRARIGVGAMSKRFDGKEENHKPKATTSSVASPVANDDEAAAMAAMFQAQTNVWEETQEKMSQAVPVFNSTRGRGAKTYVNRSVHHQQPDRPLPPSYVCYRCGQKGHWIFDCPTNNDREYDNRPRIKRTTGIPRSFLKSVDQPSEGQLAQGIMVTPDGGYVVAQPDVASWQKQAARPKGPTPSDIREKQPSDPSLVCPIDNKLFLDAVKTPCCGKVYCEECLHSHLLENNFICPNCSKRISSVDKLLIDKPMRTRVGDYIDKIIKETREAEESVLKAMDTQNQEPVDSDAASKNDIDVQFDQQPGNSFDISQLLNETIPQLQAQIAQLSVMLQNPALPMSVRQTTEFRSQQYQMQLQQAQAFAAFAADMSAVAAAQQSASSINQNFPQSQWVGPLLNQQSPSQDSPYQRLPLYGRRRSNKRDRPSDFLEVGGGDPQAKMPRFWE